MFASTANRRFSHNLIPIVHLGLILALSLTPITPLQASTVQRSEAQTSSAGGPLITATKTDALLVDNDGDTLADAGDTLRYSVILSNTGVDDALGVVFSDTLDANTTLSGTVRASPIALSDIYTATQDTPLTVAASGVLANDFGLPAPSAVTQTSAPTAQGGTITLNADGSFTYTPPASFSGTDSFSYTNTNSSGNDSASVTLTVLAPPTANPDSYNTLQNTPLSVPAGTGVLANDVVNGGSIISYAATTTQGGSVALNLDGSFVYTPTTGFFSPPVDTFTYTVSNAVGSDTATVSITVNLPAPPTAVDDVYTATANISLTVPAAGVLANDTVNAATISGYQANTAQGGTVTLNADGGFTYTPPANFISPPTDTFTYTLTNGLGSSTATVSLTVIPAGPPVAVNDAYTATANTPLNVGAPGVLGNDTLNFGAISAYAATTTQGGSVTLNANGSFIYTPTLNFVSPPSDTFTYTVSNGLGNSTATVSLTVNPPAPPIAADDAYTTTINTPLNVSAPGVLGNDTTNFGALTAYAATSTQGGAVTLNADGSFTYTPTLNFVSPPTDTFTYTLSNALGNSTATVSITVNPAGAPVAVDDIYTATVDTALNVPAPGVLGNDTLNFGGLAAYAASTTRGGAVTLNADGSFTYNPPAGVISPPNDTFTYTLTNTVGSSTAIVTLTINPAGPPVAVDDSYTTTANTPLNVSAPGVLGNDTLNFATITSYQANTARGGTVVLAASGAFTYTPPAGTISPPADTFTYTLSNVLGNSTATVSITIDPPGPPLAVNDTYTATADTPLNVSAPGVLSNDTVNFATLSSYQANTTRGGTVTLDASGAFTYTPPASTISPPTDSFTYTLSNVLGDSTATVTLNINPPGSPVAVNDNYTTTANTPLNVSAPGVLGNDTVNFATVSGYAATTTRGGTVTLNVDGSFSYTPPANVVSPPTDTFTYTLTNVLGSSTGTVNITINPPAPPVAVNDSYTTTANTQKIVAAPGVLANDTVNFATITGYQASTARGGTVVLAASGAFTYTPPSNVVSPPNDTFTYTLGNLLGSSTATVTITIDPPGPPLAVADTYTATQNTQRTFSAPGVLGNDTVNFATITSYQASTTQGGTVVLAASGAFTYTPPTSFVSPPNDTFTYTLGNALGNSTATVDITVYPPPPDAVNDAYNVTGNIQISVTAPGLLGNDTLNTASLSFSPTVSAQGGNVAVNANGSFTYNPPAGFEGTDTFTYTLTNITTSDTATVTLTITDVVWFVDNTAGAGGSGRLGAPYNSLSSLQGADSDESGDVIFVYQGSGDYTGGLPLEASQALIGQGVSLSSALTALGITLAPNSAALPSATANPNIINTGGNALTLSTNNTVRGVNLGNASGASLSGSSFGALTADTVTINNTTGAAITLTTGTANVTFTSVSSTGGTNGVNLNGVGGTLTLGTGVLSGATGATFNMTGGTATMTYSGNVTQANNAALVSVSGGHTTGTLTFQTGTLSASNGTGLQFDNADGTYNFNGTNTLSGGNAGIDILNGSAGTFSFSSNTSITNPSGTAFNLDASNANVTYSGSLSDNTGFLVDINNHDAGTVTFQTGTINSTASGIRVQNSGAGTVSFTNATKTLTTGTAAAVTLSSNTGSTVTFSGGGLVINSTSGAGFTATGGGTVNVTGSGNAITSTTGTALNVASTTIGSGDLIFRSISTNGATNGIVLNNTGASGGLTITGNGGTCTSAATCTGGAIQNTTNAVLLTAANDIAIDRMFIQNTTDSGIKGTQVVNFAFTNGTIDNSGTGLGAETSNIAFNTTAAGTENNLSGVVTITANTLTNAYYHGIDIFNFNGTISDANISNNTITSSNSTATSKGSGIRFIAFGSATTIANVTRATIANNIVSNFPSGAGIMAQGGNGNAAGPAGIFGIAGSATDIIAITGNRVAGFSAANRIGTQALIGVVNGRGQGNFNISNNGTVANPISNVFGTAIAVSSFGFANVTANVSNNIIVANNAVGSQGIGAGTGRTFTAADTPTLSLIISNNNISQTDGNGILTVARDATGQLNVRITNNTVAAPLGGVRPGIRIDAGNTNSADDAVCLDISGNTSAGSGGSQGLGLRKQGTTTTTNDFGVEGMVATSSPGVEAYVDGLNPAGGGTLLISAISGFSNCSSAPLLAATLMQDKTTSSIANVGSILQTIGTLPAGKAVTLTFDATINNPLPPATIQVSNQGTVSGSNFANVLTDDPATGTANDPTITPVDAPTIFPLYLPLIGRSFGNAPDLIGSFSLNPNQTTFGPGQAVTITVVITNVGTFPASNFWADFYINPTNPPTAGNQPWDVACGRPLDQCYGIAWLIPGPLNPGQSITLNSTPGSYFAANTIWPGYFPSGTTDVYLYVDSYSDDGSPNAAVLEGNEANNRAELHGLSVSGPLADVPEIYHPDELPERSIK